MFTRCPKCKTVHPLTAAALSRSTGLVQCGRCDRIFNALSFLSDDWHGAQPAKPVEAVEGPMPVLGGHRRRHKPRKSSAAPSDENTLAAETVSVGVHQAVPDKAPTSKTETTDKKDSATGVSTNNQKPAIKNSPQGWLWGTLAVTVLVITLANMAWTFKDGWLQRPVVQQWLQQNGWLETKQEKPQGMFKDPARIQLVSRDMHTHPTRTGILVMSVTFVNLAEETQAFPVLRITLLDAGNQAVAQRRFQPEDYLRIGANIQSGLAPDVFLPVLLELADPGEQAVGFEIEFL